MPERKELKTGRRHRRSRRRVSRANHSKQRGRGVSESHAEKYLENSKRKAFKLLQNDGIISKKSKNAIKQGLKEDPHVRFIVHILKMLVNVENKAALCAGPHIRAVEDLGRAEPLLLRTTRAAISKSAKGRLNPEAASLAITEPLRQLLLSTRMKNACEDKDGIVTRIREDVRRRWKNMQRLMPNDSAIWKKLSNADPAFIESLEAAVNRSWKTVLLAALVMGGAIGTRVTADKLRRDPVLREELYAAAAGHGDVMAKKQTAGVANVSEAARRVVGATPSPQPAHSFLWRHAHALLSVAGVGILIKLLSGSYASSAEGTNAHGTENSASQVEPLESQALAPHYYPSAPPPDTLD